MQDWDDAEASLGVLPPFVRVPALGIPAYAGMTVLGARMTGGATLPLWIADQVRNDVTSWPAGTRRVVPHPSPLDCGSSKSSMTGGNGT